MTKPSLSEVIEWAKYAGGLLREGYGKQHQVNLKGRIDLVTEMDQQSETYLLEQIRGRYPKHTIFAEESGQTAGQEDLCWYIDPLDGTTNYAHAIPFFSVSIAYAEAGSLVLGVVYDPMRDECFSAERGKGAWCNGKAIYVSETDNLLYSLLVTGFPYDSGPNGNNNLSSFSHFTQLSQGVRRLGSAALDLCYVGAGRFEGYWEQTLRPYDFAAGALIVTEAGGRITNLEGSTDLMNSPYSILAGNPAIHALMLGEFQQM